MKKYLTISVGYFFVLYSYVDSYISLQVGIL